MSQFRQQLHAAQLSYHAPLYPDDLATQLFPPRRNIWPRIIGTVVLGLAAALIVVVLLDQAIVPAAPQHEMVFKRPQRLMLDQNGVPSNPSMPQNIMPK